MARHERCRVAASPAGERRFGALYSTASRCRRRLSWAIRRTRKACAGSPAPPITAPCPSTKSRTRSCRLGRISHGHRRGAGTKCASSTALCGTDATRRPIQRNAEAVASESGNGRQHRLRHQHARQAHASASDDAVARAGRLPDRRSPSGLQGTHGIVLGATRQATQGPEHPSGDVGSRNPIARLPLPLGGTERRSAGRRRRVLEAVQPAVLPVPQRSGRDRPKPRRGDHRARVGVRRRHHHHQQHAQHRPLRGERGRHRPTSGGTPAFSSPPTTPCSPPTPRARHPATCWRRLWRRLGRIICVSSTWRKPSWSWTACAPGSLQA